jgi:hypothetical protein
MVLFHNLKMSDELNSPSEQSSSEAETEIPSIYGIVYQITSPHLKNADGICKKYIGSTTKTLEARFSKHRNLYYNQTTSRFIIEAGDSKIEILECGRYVDRDALKLRERFYIESQPGLVVNVKIPGRNPRSASKAFRVRNRDRLNSAKKDKIKCDICDRYISRSNMATHRYSEIHLNHTINDKTV